MLVTEIDHLSYRHCLQEFFSYGDRENYNIREGLQKKEINPSRFVLIVPSVSVSRGTVLCDTLKQGDIQYNHTLNC